MKAVYQEICRLSVRKSRRSSFALDYQGAQEAVLNHLCKSRTGKMNPHTNVWGLYD